MKFVVRSEAETEALGERLGKQLKSGTVVALSGNLGSGKTVFVRGIAKGLNLNARVISPTYTIVNEYPGEIPLFHFDMYRLHSADELFDIGWEDYLERGGVCAVEWSENIQDALSEKDIRVMITRADETSRIIEIEGVDLF